MATAQASPEPTLGFPPKGSLKRFPFPRLLREIAGAKLTGSLYLLSTQTKKVVFFEKGQPVFVRSNVLSECLGQILAHEGLITQEQCEQTLEAIRRTGKKQGELLVEMGILSEGNLRYGLAAQLRAKLFDIFSWNDGRYQFKRDTPDLQFGIRLDACAEGVIVEAIQDQYTEERARALLADAMAKYPLSMPDTAPNAEALKLLPEEAHFLASLDGSRPVSDVLESPPEPAVPSPAALLFGLSQSGVVEMASDAKPARAAPRTPNLGPGDQDDLALAPSFEPVNKVTEYEDTPLPGELPKSPGLLGDHEDDFAGVEDSGVHRVEVSEQLKAAEGGPIDETFDDSLIDIESQMELIDAADIDIETDFEDLAGDDPQALSDSPADEVAAAPEPEPEPVAEAPEPEPPAVVEPANESVPDPGDAGVAAKADAPTMAEPEAPPLVAADADPAAGPAPDLAADPPGDPPGDPTKPPELSLPVAEDDDDPISIDPISIGSLEALDDDDEPEAPASLPADDAADDDDIALDLEGFEADDDLAIDDAADPSANASPAPGANGRDPAPLADAEAGLDDIDLGDIDGDLALDDDLDDLDFSDLDDIDGVDPAAPASPAAAQAPGPHAAAAADGDALVDFDDLDAVDLGGLDDIAVEGSNDSVEIIESIEPVSIDPEDAEEVVEEESPEVLGARRFNDAETALGESRYDEAVGLLEEAYDNGFDVAELHAMLAYARFMASGQDSATADHAFELLDYAQNMDPSLDLVHAYRGTILQATGKSDRARESLERALELNPYCELAMEVMDSLG
ncbi:MAG: DUF4388 domain-containing protein [Myxococcota bacterium]